MRYPFLAKGQARHWIDSERDREWVRAVFEWVLDSLCDSDTDVESEHVEVPEGTVEVTDVHHLGVVVTWRLARQGTRIDVLKVEPLP